MTLTRRRALEILAGTVAATGTGCNGNGQSAQPATNATSNAVQTSPSPSASSGSHDLTILFSGLNLFRVQSGSVQVAMPKPQSGMAPHPAWLLIVGGAIAPKGTVPFATSEFVSGVDIHACSLAGKRLEMHSDAKPAFRAYDDPVSFTTQPTTADEWRSLRWIIDVEKMYPKVTLRSDWDTAHSEAVVSITEGEVMALPASGSFDGLWNVVAGTQVAHQQYMTGGVGWRLPIARSVTVMLSDLSTGANAQTSQINVDSTGPIAALIAHRPVGNSGMSHIRATEALFDGLSTVRTGRVELEPATAKPSPPTVQPMSVPTAGFSLQFLQQLFDKFEDGSARCPPSSFRA